MSGTAQESFTQFDGHDVIKALTSAMVGAGWRVDWEATRIPTGTEMATGAPTHAVWVDGVDLCQIEIKSLITGTHRIIGPGFDLTLESDVSPVCLALLIEALMGGLR